MQMPIITIEQANRCAVSAQAIVQADADYRSHIEEIARSIYATRHEKSVILLVGPSGSGKTTTAHMLDGFLDTMGTETHTISLDNYFIPFTEEQLVLAAEGKIDFESPDRMDIPFLNEQLEAIAKCKPIHLPEYDFVHSKRLFRPETFCRKDGELVLLEGIHALNPAVILMPEDQLTNIYISVRTRIETEQGLLHPSYLRLLRRIMRDKRTRGRSAEETIAMFENVEAGEKKFISPYKYRAHHEIDSFHPYELGLYAAACHPEIENIAAENERYLHLATTMAQACATPVDFLPQSSLIREFIGD